MSATPSFWTRMRHALFGKPLTHEEVRARSNTEAARLRDTGQNESRARSVQNQTWTF